MNTTQPRNNTLPVWRGTWALIRYRPWPFAANMIFGVVLIVSELLPGLITRRFFDELTGAAPATFGDVYKRQPLLPCSPAPPHGRKTFYEYNTT